MTAESLALAAEALEGAPFRLHGRDPVTGLDCIGVLAQSLEAFGQKCNPMFLLYIFRNCTRRWLQLFHSYNLK